MLDLNLRPVWLDAKRTLLYGRKERASVSSEMCGIRTRFLKSLIMPFARVSFKGKDKIDTVPHTVSLLSILAIPILLGIWRGMRHGDCSQGEKLCCYCVWLGHLANVNSLSQFSWEFCVFSCCISNLCSSPAISRILNVPTLEMGSWNLDYGQRCHQCQNSSWKLPDSKDHGASSNVRCLSWHAEAENRLSILDSPGLSPSYACFPVDLPYFCWILPMTCGKGRVLGLSGAYWGKT